MDFPLEQSNNLKLVALARANYSGALGPVELEIIHDSVRQGGANPHPDARREDRTVPGEFFRWLLNDKSVAPLMNKDGLYVEAVTIVGSIDSDSSDIPYPLIFLRCLFTGAVHFTWARTRSITMTACTASKGVRFENATISGDLALDGKFECPDQVTLYGAQITGDLDMREARLTRYDPGGDQFSVTLSLNAATVEGNVQLDGMRCAGRVAMLGTKVGNLLSANTARFDSAVMMDGLNVEGSVYLNQAHAVGTLSMVHASVGGSVDLREATLDDGTLSLSLQNATIAGSVLFDGERFRASGPISLAHAVVKQIFGIGDHAKLVTVDCNNADVGFLAVNQAEISELDCTDAQIGDFTWVGIVNAKTARLNLSRATVKRFRDEQQSWPSAGNLKVTDFSYTDISLKVPLDRDAFLKAADASCWGEEKNCGDEVDSRGRTTARLKVEAIDGENDPHDRIRWLERQGERDVVGSQPWKQLAEYVQARGNSYGGKQVLYHMTRTQRWADAWYWPAWLFDWPYDFIEEYPLRVLIPITMLWLFGWLIFWRARRMKAMAPTDSDAYEHFAKFGSQPDGYVPFDPAVYALENVLPVVKFGQDAAWGPNPQSETAPDEAARPRWMPRLSYKKLAVTRWVLIILGWLLALILVSALGDRFKS